MNKTKTVSPEVTPDTDAAHSISERFDQLFHQLQTIGAAVGSEAAGNYGVREAIEVTIYNTADTLSTLCEDVLGALRGGAR